MSKLKSKFLPIILLTLLIISSICASIDIVQAGGTFVKNSNVWGNINSDVAATPNDYPYSGLGRSKNASNYTEEQLSHIPDSEKQKIASSGKVKSVSMDILYGIKKSLVSYHGELPYNNVHEEEGKDGEKIRDGFSGYPMIPGTDAYQPDIDKDPSVSHNPNGASAMDYWGFNMSQNNFSHLINVAEVNKDKTVSLRLYALTITDSGWWAFLKNIGYIIFQWFAWLASMIVTLIVSAKNIDMSGILEVLHIDDLSELITKIFIYNDDIGIAPFAAFCIIMLIFAFVGYAIRWVKGAEKTRGIWSLVGTAALGLLFIGVALAGKMGDLGSTVSNAAEKVMYAVSTSLSGGENGNAFVVDIDDKDHENKVMQMQELALVYKPYIDIQIDTQFGVNDVRELDFDKLGDANGTNAKNYLAGGIDKNTDLKKEFNNNLGYYFWFADSNAVSKTPSNATYPELRAGAAEDKLHSIITYLQVQYNNQSNSSLRPTILDITASFADTNAGTGILRMILMTAIILILAFVLLKYALNVLVSKIGLFVALLGLTIAGPLIITNKPSLVKTGKTIIGMLLVCFIEITVWSIFFDMIIYTVATILSADLLNMFVTLAFLLLFLKFNPIIAEKVKKMLDDGTRAMCPTYHQSRNVLKQRLQRLGSDVKRKYDNSEKIVGKNADGTPIYEKRGGNTTSKMLGFMVNGLQSPQSRKSWGKLNKEEQANRAQNQGKTKQQIRNNAKQKVKEIETNITNNSKKTYEQIMAEGKERLNEYKVYDDNNQEQLAFNSNMMQSAEEINLNNDIQSIDDEMHAIETNETYTALKTIPIDERTELEESQLQDYTNRLVELKQAASQKKDELSQIIKAREMSSYAKDRFGIVAPTKIERGDTIEKAYERTVKEHYTNAHKEEYKQALEEQINADSQCTNEPTMSSGKIGNSGRRVSPINREAVESQAMATLKLHQLNNNQTVSTDDEAKDAVQGIVQAVDTQARSTVRDKVKHPVQHTAEHLADINSKHVRTEQEKQAKARIKQFKRGSQARKDAEEAYAKLRRDNKQAQDIARNEQQNVIKQAKQEAGRTFTRADITEVINTTINNEVQVRTADQIKAQNTKAVIEQQNELKNNAKNSTNKPTAKPAPKPATESDEVKPTKAETVYKDIDQTIKDMTGSNNTTDSTNKPVDSKPLEIKFNTKEPIKSKDSSKPSTKPTESKPTSSTESDVYSKSNINKSIEEITSKTDRQAEIDNQQKAVMEAEAEVTKLDDLIAIEEEKSRLAKEQRNLDESTDFTYFERERERQATSFADEERMRERDSLIEDADDVRLYEKGTNNRPTKLGE